MKDFQISNIPYDQCGIRTSEAEAVTEESIKMLLMFLIANGDDHKWTPLVSVQHGKAMYDLLKSYHQSVSDT